MVLDGIRWYVMFDGIPWNSLEFVGIRWDLGFDGIQRLMVFSV